MPEKKVVKLLKPKISKIIIIKDPVTIISPPKFKTKQVKWREHFRLGNKVKEHTKTKRIEI